MTDIRHPRTTPLRKQQSEMQGRSLSSSPMRFAATRAAMAGCVVLVLIVAVLLLGSAFVSHHL